jgi:UDP-glucose 4-epimerase
VSGTQIPFRFREARGGDPAELIANSSLAMEILGWSPKKNLEDIVSDLWIARLLKTSLDE